MSLLDELESEARARSASLETMCKLPGPRRCPPDGFTDRHYPLTAREQRELRRLKAACEAATDVDTFVALCKGLPVPAARLSRPLVTFKRRIDDVRG